MEIVTLPIDSLVPAKYNPRKNLKPTDPEYIKLKKSMLEFDYIDPIVWNRRTGNVVGGHQRLKILRELGRTEVEVSVVDLDDAKEKALNIALNKTGGEFDFPMLKDLLVEIDTGAFDIEITGFDQKEIERLIGIQPEETFDRPENRPGYKEQYGIIIVCKDEQEQELFFGRLQAEGYSCRVVAT